MRGIPRLGVAYTVPDIDALARITIRAQDTGKTIACIETRVTNGKTVNQQAVAWVLAVITGLGFLASIVTSLLGHTTIATHVSFRTLIFLGFMQSMAIAGMTAVTQTPLVQSWTQLFQWTMGLVHADFLTKLCTWFQRATGGTASDLIYSTTKSVYMAKRAVGSLAKRAATTTEGGSEQTVRGIERVGYRIDIPSSNIFLTGYVIFYFVALIVTLGAIFLCFVLPAIAKKANNSKLDNAAGATAEWKTYMRGTFYRLAALGYPQMCVLCMWELVQRDSPAEIVLAITMWLVMSAVLACAVFKVFQRAQVSRSLKETPAYTLYSDPVCLTKWGFLYVFYKAQYFWFLVPMTAYIIIKSFVIAFGQASGTAQAIILLIVELAMMVGTCVFRPYMNKTANSLAITASVLNFLNAISLLIFSGVFNQPDLCTGVVSVLFTLWNAVFTLVLLCFLLTSFYYAVTLKEPTGRYKRLSDNRESFRLSGAGPENRMTTELLPLEKAIKGHSADDFHSDSRWNIREPGHDTGRYRPQSRDDFNRPPRSPMNDVLEPTLPLIPSSSPHSHSPSPHHPSSPRFHPGARSPV